MAAVSDVFGTGKRGLGGERETLETASGQLRQRWNPFRGRGWRRGFLGVDFKLIEIAWLAYESPSSDLPLLLSCGKEPGRRRNNNSEGKSWRFNRSKICTIVDVCVLKIDCTWDFYR